MYNGSLIVRWILVCTCPAIALRFIFYAPVICCLLKYSRLCENCKFCKKYPQISNCFESEALVDICGNTSMNYKCTKTHCESWQEFFWGVGVGFCSTFWRAGLNAQPFYLEAGCSLNQQTNIKSYVKAYSNVHFCSELCLIICLKVCDEQKSESHFSTELGMSYF